MRVEEIADLTLADMKRVAKELSITGYQNVTTKSVMLSKINAKIYEMGLLEVPDLEAEPEAVIERPKYARISHHPKIKCVVETRDENEVDLPIGINEYQCYIQFGKEIEIPEPVYNMVKGLTTIKFEKDENGFTKSKEINKYIVSKV